VLRLSLLLCPAPTLVLGTIMPTIMESYHFRQGHMAPELPVTAGLAAASPSLRTRSTNGPTERQAQFQNIGSTSHSNAVLPRAPAAATKCSLPNKSKQEVNCCQQPSMKCNVLPAAQHEV